MRRLPFIWVEGEPYLDITFDLEPITPTSPEQLVNRVLSHHPPTAIRILRPLSSNERALLEASMHSSAVEAWARIVVGPEDRFRSRPTSEVPNEAG
jgi:hypothetical protein